MSDDRKTEPAPPPASEAPTRPDNERPVIVDEPGLAALANLIDDHLGSFLEKQEARDKRQEERDEKLRELVVDVLNEAMINRDQMNKIEGRQDSHEERIANLEKAVKALELRHG